MNYLEKNFRNKIINSGLKDNHLLYNIAIILSDTKENIWDDVCEELERHIEDNKSYDEESIYSAIEYLEENLDSVIECVVDKAMNAVIKAFKEDQKC